MNPSDFNISPEDPAYAILLGSPLTEKQRSVLNASLLIHATVDPSIQGAYERRPIDVDSDEEEEGERQGQTTGQARTEAQEQAASGILPNTRRAELRDGLLSEQELRAMARFAWLGMSMRVHVLTGVPDRRQWHLCKALTTKAYRSSHKRASLRFSGEWTG
jgi:hypothetical protein